MAVENRSEEFKREFIRRLSQVFQEEEDVLVISLGYSAIECPGMLSEEKVTLLFVVITDLPTPYKGKCRVS